MRTPLCLNIFSSVAIFWIISSVLASLNKTQNSFGKWPSTKKDSLQKERIRMKSCRWEHSLTTTRSFILMRWRPTKIAYLNQLWDREWSISAYFSSLGSLTISFSRIITSIGRKLSCKFARCLKHMEKIVSIVLCCLPYSCVIESGFSWGLLQRYSFKLLTKKTSVYRSSINAPRILSSRIKIA